MTHHPEPHVREIRSSRFFLQAAVVLFTIAVTIPVAVFFVGGRGADDFISEHLTRSQLEERFGFVAAPLPNGAEPRGRLPVRIVAIVPGGAFHQAGVQVGDIPLIDPRRGGYTGTFFQGHLRAGPGPFELVFLRGPGLTPVSVDVYPPKRTGRA